jgi:HPt (histidine-containing phosphotransfer) domain-containing protein
VTDARIPLLDPARLSELAELFAPDELAGLLDTCADEVLAALATAREACGGGHHAALAGAAHTIRNSGAMIGAEQLAARATALEAAARAEASADGLAESVAALEECWRATSDAVAAVPGLGR